MQLKINGKSVRNIETTSDKNESRTAVGILHENRNVEYASNKKPKTANPVLHRKGTIIVNDLTLVVTKENDEAPVIRIEVEMAQLDDGTVPVIEFDEPIVLTKTDLRKSVLTSVIHKKMIEMYPEKFYPDAEVIINNYATVIRKDVRTFEEFKDDSLYTLQYTCMLDTGIDD